jgi:TPR repeat protein
MRRRLLLLAVLQFCGLPSSFGQSLQDSPPQPPFESPPPPPEALGDEHSKPPRATFEQLDAAMALGESRGAVRLNWERAAGRLELARALYRIGDLEAAMEECRAAIKLQPDDAKTHLQLGIILVAKQDWHAAASVLHEAVRLDPALTDAYYTLGSVNYSLGRVSAAMQSYRQALALQPYFPDARYRLALLLKVSKQDREAAQFMEEAALGGVPQAQYFLGNAYKTGRGVDKDLGKAVFWWAKAAEYGYQPSVDEFGKLRRQALSQDQPGRTRKAAQDALTAYRRRLWEEFREYSPSNDSETIGTRLFNDHRTDVAVPTLLREGYALSEAAQLVLERVYEQGWDDVMPPHEKKILACFEVTAGDGFLPAKRALARIYGKGIGVPADRSKAKATLKGLPTQEAKERLAEFDAR